LKSTLVAQPETFFPADERDFRRGEPGEARRPNSTVVRRAAATKASSIILVGTSFKTSSIAFREALARRLSRGSAKLASLEGVKESARLVTCNRIEIVIAADSSSAAERAVLGWLSEIPGATPSSIYLRRDVDAIAHLFRVASGLDSMVLGEEQILSQVRDAGIEARTSRSSRGSLSALFDASVNVGKRARDILDRPDESVSSMAIRFAMGRLPRAPRRVLLIGTGKTTRLAANQLDGARVFVATRRASLPSFSRATLVSHADLRRVAATCDLIVSATKHRGYLLKKGDLGDKRRVILDLGFPRNVDPALNEGRVEVYNLEDLAKEFAPRQPGAGPAAKRAEELVLAEAESFSRWLLASRQSSALSGVYRWAETTRRGETDSALRRLPRLSEREKKVVEAMSRRLVSKLLAPPASFVKSSSPDLPQDERLDLVQRVFDREEK
jgi:glutamyl-tRNA reductase